MSDPVELARSIRTLAYREWVDIVDGTMFLTCYACGCSHQQLYRVTGPDMLRVRIDYDAELTDAAREHNEYPLYKEVLALREENMQLKRKQKAVCDWINERGDPFYHGQIEEMLRG